MTLKLVNRLVNWVLTDLQPLKSLPSSFPSIDANRETRQPELRGSALGDWLTQTVAYHH